MATNVVARRSVVLKQRPRGEPEPTDFEIQESAIPTPRPMSMTLAKYPMGSATRPIAGRSAKVRSIQFSNSGMALFFCSVLTPAA